MKRGFGYFPEAPFLHGHRSGPSVEGYVMRMVRKPTAVFDSQAFRAIIGTGSWASWTTTVAYGFTDPSSMSSCKTDFPFPSPD
jgi:hypothetical protein